MIIYKTTNKINGKIYVGQTKHPNKNHYLGSGTYIKKSIKKYGKENFLRETIEVCDNERHMNERELYWIKMLDATNKTIGYNVKDWIDGEYSVESRKSQGCKGHTPETRGKISQALKHYKRTDEHQESLSNSLINKDLSYITKDYKSKMSEITSGEGNGMYGKKHSDDSRKKISESRKGSVAWNKGKDGSKYYTTSLINCLNKIQKFYNIPYEVIIENLDLYVKKSKADGVIPKNKGITYKTLKKYKIIDG